MYQPQTNHGPPISVNIPSWATSGVKVVLRVVKTASAPCTLASRATMGLAEVNALKAKVARTAILEKENIVDFLGEKECGLKRK